MPRALSSADTAQPPHGEEPSRAIPVGNPTTSAQYAIAEPLRHNPAQHNYNQQAAAQQAPGHYQDSSSAQGSSATQYLDLNKAGPGVLNDRRTSMIGRVKLIVEQGRILGEQYLLNEHDIIIGRYDAGTGRCPDIDLSAQDPAYVHRQHARLRFDEPGEIVMLYDLGGRNGAYVNNRPLDRNGSAQVRIGDKIRIGRVVMRLQPAPEMDRYGQPQKS